MALRIMLVGFVASMGFDLPGDRDLARWTQSGRAWVDARLADLSGPRAEGDRALASAPDGCVRACEAAVPAASCEPVLNEAVLAFEAASDAMVAEFTAALAIESRPEPAVVRIVAEGPTFVALPSGEELMCMAVTVAEADPVAPQSVAAAEEGDDPAPADRLYSAVRLTGEAIEAWAAVLR